ncbi:MAG: hypothetical protein BWY44_01260 [Candidatus Omnitrophica bacterium ADurb.Bin292]|nr:MAG: hypothetical protein BWY44_01260 [Candidatus Omnitrophica bacterium ADurb.Bin292]
MFPPSQRVGDHRHRASPHSPHHKANEHHHRKSKRHRRQRLSPQPGNKPRVDHVIHVHGEGPGKHRNRHTKNRQKHFILDQTRHPTPNLLKRSFSCFKKWTKYPELHSLRSARGSRAWASGKQKPSRRENNFFKTSRVRPRLSAHLQFRENGFKPVLQIR